MPEANEDEKGGWKECDWYQIGSLLVQTLTLVVLFITMIGIFRYADDAATANGLTRESIDSISRPYLEIFVDPNQVIQRVIRIELGEAEVNTVGLTFRVPNNGKLPAQATIQSIVKYSPEHLSISPDLKAAKSQSRFIWPQVYEAFTALGDDSLSPGQYSDIRAGLGFIYFKARVTYGRHATQVCWEFPIGAAADVKTNPTGPTLASLGSFQNCPGKPEDNNYAN